MALLNLRILARYIQLRRNYPFTRARIERLQTAKLRRLLVHAYERFAFYRERMEEASLNPYRFERIEELQKLPVIDRAAYRDFTETVVASDPRRYERYWRDETSGSSGTPLRVLRSRSEQAYLIAKFMRALFLNGFRLTDRTLCIKMPAHVQEHEGSDSLLQRLGIMPRTLVSAAEPPARWVDAYVKTRPDLFYGNRTDLVHMALNALDRDIRLPPARLVLCVGEVLNPTSRAVIERVFGSANLREIYGATEFSNLAFQAPGDRHLTFCHDTNIIELVDCPAGNEHTGSAVITDLHTWSFPLIRYNLGDRLDTEMKDGLRVVRAILGRDDDVILLKDGSLRSGAMVDVLLGGHRDVLQYRVIQETLTEVTVQLVLDARADRAATAETVRAEMARHLGGLARVTVEPVPTIAPDPNGKLRMLISRVSKGLGGTR